MPSWNSRGLRGSILLLVHEVHRYAHDHMEAAVAVGLRRADVVLHRHHEQVVLRLQVVQDVVDVLDVGDDDPQPRDVHDVLLHGLEGGALLVAPQLLEDGGDGLHARLDVVDGVPVLAQPEVLVEGLEPHLHLAHGGMVLGQDVLGGVLQHRQGVDVVLAQGAAGGELAGALLAAVVEGAAVGLGCGRAYLIQGVRAAHGLRCSLPLSVACPLL